jgi:hypothetical protein
MVSLALGAITWSLKAVLSLVVEYLTVNEKSGSFDKGTESDPTQIFQMEQ